MIERISETCIWENLKKETLPIILYGMGNGADMIIDVMQEKNIKFADIFAGDAFVRGHSFHGIRVKKFSEIEALYEDFVIVMTFAVHDEPTMGYVRQLNKKHKVLSPTVPIAGKGLFTLAYIKEHNEEFERAYNMLCDEQSKKAYLDILNFKVSGKIEYLFSSQSEKSEIYKNVLKLSENEIIADLGAYDGDTIREFLTVTNGRYTKIYALEADEKTFGKLKKKTAETANIELYNIGAWDKKEIQCFKRSAGRNSHRAEEGIPVQFDALDNIVKEVTFVKMDIEGAEGKAIDGMKRLIETCHPKLYICAYHRNEDMFDLIFRIKKIYPDYKVYFRHHPYIPSWESNLYFI